MQGIAFSDDPETQTHCPVCLESLSDPTPEPCSWCGMVVDFRCAGDITRGLCHDCVAGDD